jgi:hypothetical protein
MKKYGITFFISLIISSSTFCQKTEFNVTAYSGLFAFRGNEAASHTWYFSGLPSVPDHFTADPYGNQNDFSYSFEVQAQRVSFKRNIYGLGISYETLASKVHIDTAAGGDIIYFQHWATGKTTLENSFITLNPFIGHRYHYHQIAFDILAGMDISGCVKNQTTTKISTNNKDYSTIEDNNPIPKPSIDFRLRIQVKAQYKKVGFIIGYSYGLTNYNKQNAPKAYSNFLRVGLNYQIR